MVASESLDELLLRMFCGPSAQFGEDQGRVSYRAGSCCNSLLVTTCTKMIDENRGVEDDKLPSMAGEFELSGVFRHQLLETLQGNDFAERSVHCFGSRLNT